MARQTTRLPKEQQYDLGHARMELAERSVDSERPALECLDGVERFLQSSAKRRQTRRLWNGP